MMPGDVEITATIKHITASAMLINDGDRDAWLPLSQIEYDEDCCTGDTTTIVIPEWMAIKKELV